MDCMAETDEARDILRKLFPHWTEEQLQLAEERLERYLEISYRIYQRIISDPAEYARFQKLVAEHKKTRQKNEHPKN